MKRLYRNEKEKMVAGVCSGIAEYFQVDPTLIRLFWVVTTAFTGFAPGLIAYAAALVIIPQK